MKYITVFFLGFCLNVFAQDPLLTNVHQSLIHLNPSFAGSNGLLRYQSNTRSQWYNLSGSYLTFYNSIDAFIKPIKGGIALNYIRDDQAHGTLVTDRFDLSYAQHLSLFDKKLKIIPSLQLSYFQKTIDNSKLNFGDQIDARRGFVWYSQNTPPHFVTKSNIDFSSGLIVNYKHFYIGSSVFHINQPDEGIMGPSKLPYRLSMFTSYNLSIGENVLLNALFRFEKQQNFYTTQFNINALLLKHIMVGSGINENTINVFAGYRHHYFSISGGYEFGLSKLSGNTGGSFEIAASFNLRNKENRKLITDFERW